MVINNKKILINNYLQRCLLLCFCCLSLIACQPEKPPIEFAPAGAVVQQAIVFQLNRTQTSISQQLNTATPDFKVSQINVENIEAIAVNNLPAYHLRGVYNLKLILPRQTVTQKRNPFDIYLQRQREGKSWRLLRREIDPRTDREQWSSYLVDFQDPDDGENS